MRKTIKIDFMTFLKRRRRRHRCLRHCRRRRRRRRRPNFLRRFQTFRTKKKI